jgi:hypothetical protein
MKNPATNDPSPTKPSSDKGVEFVGVVAHSMYAFDVAEVLPRDDSGAHDDIAGCGELSFGEVCENANGANNRANNTSIRETLMRFSENGKKFS